ncbi:MAG: hypothetical protein KF887_17540 [Paracoccaceae bacterium]|nr:MAG: hypothetical protein KF887_17540 [Paracoccaceae bacterium]
MRGLVLAGLMLAACTLPGAEPRPVPPDAAAIEVTTLDAPAAEASAAAGPPAAPETAAPSAPGPEAAPPAPEAVPPPVRPSPQAAACTRQGGTYLSLGKAGLAACQLPTRDGLRSCRRKGDCEGECLARSGTCAPVRPLFGCNEVLDDMGRRMTQCLD